MKNKFQKFCLMLVAMLTSVSISAQITGVVMAEGEPDPVIGANVILKGTTVGTITDFDGNFTVDAKPGDVLVISFMGYKSMEVKATSAPMKVTLKPDNVMLDEVVAVGYGTMKKSDLTGAVTSVSAADLMKAPVSGLDQALQGRAAGVTVTSNSGQPGEAATIRIRGIGSAMGGNDPLYVVDGVLTSDISFVSPNDIQSMEILKDASATAIYGSRGANGVILITTKSGGEGKAHVSFDAYWGFQNRWKKLNLMTSKDQADYSLRIQAMSAGAEEIGTYYKYGFNNWLKQKTSDVWWPTNFDYAAQETDWQDEVFRKNALIHNYNISVDGGGEKGHYALSVGYFGQEGTILGSNYHRITARSNADYNPFKWLTIGEHLSFMVSGGRSAMNNNADGGASVLSAALAMAPWDPVYYPIGAKNSEGKDLSGSYAQGSNNENVLNPLIMVNNSHPQNQNDRLVGDIYLEIKPIKGLVIRPSLSLDYSIYRSRTYTGPQTYNKYLYDEKNRVGSDMNRYCTLQEDVTATYSSTIGKHNFSVMVGQTWSEYNYYHLGGSGATILNPIPSNWYLNKTTEDKTESSDGVARVRRLSFLGRAYYCYDSRYMATVNFRADASSKFSKNPWGFFPSVALAWRLSEEHFIKDAGVEGWLDNIKIRAGWGQVGNDGVNSGSFVATMTSNTLVFTDYTLGTSQQAALGAAVLTQVNTAGKWETNEQWDAGVDFSFWNGMLSGTLDYFRRDTKDALLEVNAPAHVGNMYPMVKNVGNIRNEGFELSLNHDNKVGQVHYNIGGNISFVRNKLTSNNGGSPVWGDKTKSDLGMPLNSYWGYKYEGIYQSEEEILAQWNAVDENGQRIYTKDNISVHPGDARYKDINGDGKLDENDYTNIGNHFPKLTYGFNLGADFYGVDIQLFFQGVYGNAIYNATRERLEGTGANATLASYMKDKVWIGYSDGIRNSLIKQGVNWMEIENREGTIPNPNSSNNFAASSRFLEDGSYLRLKNVQIGYTFPKKWTQKFRCERLRVYATASNLFTITKYSGYDPEVGHTVDYGNYPQSRTFTFGLNVNF